MGDESYIFGKEFHKKWFEPRPISPNSQKPAKPGEKQQEDAAQAHSLLDYHRKQIEANKTLLVIDKDDGAEIYKFFMNSDVERSRLTENHLVFLQAAMMAAIDASGKIGLLQALWESSVAPSSLGSFMKKLARKVIVAQYKHHKNDADIMKARIYMMVKVVLVQQANYEFRAITAGLD
jgi:hypothetical protein